MKQMNSFTPPISAGRVYEAPELRSVELRTEGVLCESGTIETWEKETFDWGD